jgi:very-short-patch-repair endonuclease
MILTFMILVAAVVVGHPCGLTGLSTAISVSIELSTVGYLLVHVYRMVWHIELVSRVKYRPDGLGGVPFLGAEAVQAGLLTKHQLVGFTRLYVGTYVHPDVLVDHLTWCQAALLLEPRGVLGLRSSLGLHCPVLLPGNGASVDLVVPKSSNIRRRMKLNVHRFNLTVVDCCKRNGFTVTNGARTAYDLACVLELAEAVVCIDALLHARQATVEGISAYVVFGGRGSVNVARALAMADSRSESPMESRTRVWLVQAGLPMPEVQYEVRLSAYVVVRLDLAYPKARVGIEYDGDYHRDKDIFRRDAVRSNLLLAAGWKVFRFTAADAANNGERIVAQIRAALHDAG